MKPISAKVREMVVVTILADPTRPYHDIAKEYGISSWSVCKFAVAAGVRRSRGAGSPSWHLKEAAR
jgi:hypothetical protein